MFSEVFEMGVKQYDALAATLQRRVSQGGNGRESQRNLGSVLYWDAEANAITDGINLF